MPEMAMAAAAPFAIADKVGFSSADNVVSPKIRKEFPETWLWEDISDPGLVNYYFK